jgi:hypothetical protein
MINLKFPVRILVTGLLLLSLFACNYPQTTQTSTASPTNNPTGASSTMPNQSITTNSPEPASTPSVISAVVNRIGIRKINEVAEFYDTVTGEKFIPRGVNYVDFKEFIPGQLWEDYIFGAGTWQPEKVRAAFRRLADGGYNTVRIFFDHCYSGPSCIGSQEMPGLNPVFLDNMVSVMQMAAEENIYLILTANGVPADGGYWSRFDQQYQQETHFGFGEFYENGYYLHKAGVDMQAQYWTDLMSGLQERGAPFEIVLGWQLQNEYWLFKNRPPLSLSAGLVEVNNGKTYDMADPAQKRQMVTEAIFFWMETLIPIIKEADPESLVTVGFFPPDFPNETELMTDWYRDTASLLATAPVDFWDFHAYPEPQTVVARNMANTAENFGMAGYQEKPIILGEFGAFRNIFPSLETGIFRMQEWVVESCEYGFDGWLIWEYYDRSADDAVWGLENDALFQTFAPINYPDPCAMVPLPPANLAYGKTVTASRFLPNEPPENVVDGGDSLWGAGADAPQWIEIELGKAVSLSEIRLWVAQYPDGEIVHQILLRDSRGNLTEVHRFEQFTRSGEWLNFTPETPIPEVTAVRVNTLFSTSWVAWSEIEIYGVINESNN